MPVFDPSMTAQKAAETLPAEALNISGHSSDTPEFVSTKGYVDATRKTRRGPVTPPRLAIDEGHRSARVRIFNVGPWPHIVPLGSMGSAVIPPCPEDKAYVEMMTPLHELETELYPSRDKKEYKELREEGRRIAVEILGEGRNQDRKQSRRHAGVFIAEGEIPTQKELADARKALLPYCQQMCDYMDRLWDRDRKLAYDVFNPDTFGKAAKVLNIKGKPWQSSGQPSDNIECPGCNASVKPTAAKCFNCGSIVNRQAYADWKVQQAEIEMEIATAPEKKGK